MEISVSKVSLTVCVGFWPGVSVPGLEPSVATEEVLVLVVEILVVEEVVVLAVEVLVLVVGLGAGIC